MEANEEENAQSVTPRGADASARRRSSVEAAAAAAAAALYGDMEPAIAAPSELRGDILDSVLRRAASDVLAVIPAQRSVIFTYDRASNMLSAYFSFSKEEATPVVSDQDAPHDEPAAFQPTLGMTGACFLHKRCLRMQEPHRHRAFHREYDVPKDIQMDSIMCTPLIIRHRAIAVIQLLNRLNPDFMEAQDDSSDLETASKVREGAEDYRDIKLHRSQSIRPQVKLGFSAKDEQKLIQFVTHLAFTAETRLKRVDDNIVTHARIRELQTSNAIELLSILNSRLERRISGGQAVVPIASAEFLHPLRPLRPQGAEDQGAPIELVGTLFAIIRLQARFHARRVRRSEKFAEALETFRKQHERVRSVLVLQRVARGCLVRKRVKKQRCAIAVLTRVYDHYRFRLKLETNRNAKRAAVSRKKSIATPPRSSTSSNTFKRRSGGVREAELVVKTRKSATAIQRHFRGHKTRQLVKQMTGFANLGKGLRNIVKLQSFVRGSLARIQFRRTKEMLKLRSMQTPPSVCLRIGMAPASMDPWVKGVDEVRSASLCCVYRLPERRSNAHVVQHRSMAPRHRLETLFDLARSHALGDTPSSPVHANTRPASIGAPMVSDSLEPVSRRLVAANESNAKPTRPMTKEIQTTPRGSVATLSRALPGLVWELQQKKGTPRPPAVEYAADRTTARLHPSSCCCHRRRRLNSNSNDSRGSLMHSNSSTTVKSSGFPTAPCSCRYCRSVVRLEDQPGSILERCDEFRREAFAAAVGQSSTLPVVASSLPKGLSTSKPPQGPLLCCLLPAQPKLGVALRCTERRHKARIASVSGDTTSVGSPSARQALAAPSHWQPANDRTA